MSSPPTLAGEWTPRGQSAASASSGADTPPLAHKLPTPDPHSPPPPPQPRTTDLDQQVMYKTLGVLHGNRPAFTAPILPGRRPAPTPRAAPATVPVRPAKAVNASSRISPPPPPVGTKRGEGTQKFPPGGDFAMSGPPFFCQIPPPPPPIFCLCTGRTGPLREKLMLLQHTAPKPLCSVPSSVDLWGRSEVVGDCTSPSPPRRNGRMRGAQPESAPPIPGVIPATPAGSACHGDRGRLGPTGTIRQWSGADSRWTGLVAVAGRGTWTAVTDGRGMFRRWVAHRRQRLARHVDQRVAFWRAVDWAARSPFHCAFRSGLPLRERQTGQAALNVIMTIAFSVSRRASPLIFSLSVASRTAGPQPALR